MRVADKLSLSIRLKRINPSDDLPLPSYATEGASGLDLRSALEIVIPAGETVLVPTGLIFEIPAGYEGQVRPRSGLAAKHQVGILNSPGTIDSDYRGEVKVILTNFGKEDFTIHRGDRIAQMVFAPIVRARIELVDSLKETERGAGGFGHTGK